MSEAANKWYPRLFMSKSIDAIKHPRAVRSKPMLFDCLLMWHSICVHCFHFKSHRQLSASPVDTARWDSELRVSFQTIKIWRHIMLSWALTFLIIALIAGALGFGGVAGEAAWVAHVLFVIFIVLFLVSLIAGRRVPPV